MCRIALYLGQPRPWGGLFTAPHGLERQAYAPREQQHGNVNVDGTGVAWWPGHAPGESATGDDAGHPGDGTGDEPLRYASLAPPWADPNLASLGPRLHARVALAAVRGATPGVGHGIEHVAPFVLGDLAIAHNGWIGGFRDGIAATLLRALPDDLVTTLPAVNDSRLLACAVVAHRRAGADLATAVAAACRDAGRVVLAAGQPATLNLVATDGREAVATRWSVGLPGNSLYVAEHAAAWPGAVVIASEPLDAGEPATATPGWTAVPDGSLVHVLGGRVVGGEFVGGRIVRSTLIEEHA